MSTLLKPSFVAIAAVAMMFSAGCQRSPVANSGRNAPTQPTAAAAPAEVVSARTAFWPMYKEAHAWAPDIVVLKVSARELPGFKNHDGKAAIWEATFASAVRRHYRVFTYSIASAPPEVRKGVTAGLEQTWQGVTRDSMPVDLSLFNVDSDAAYAAAAETAAAWLKANPNKELASLEIGDTYKFQAPVWYMMWGTKNSGYIALIDANTGKPLHRK